MKNPGKLLRMGRIWGILMLIAMPVVGQEVGTAIKAPTLNLATNSVSVGATTFKPIHKRSQARLRALPVEDTSQTTRRTALARPQSIDEEPQPQTLSDPSPSPSQSFVALPDNGEVAPPDTHGAASPSHLVVACASEIRVQDRLGNPISTRSQEAFWSGVASNIFDTRVVYDPY
ncbi:MAG TPA: hypothetical protein VJ063_20745, partial [Verrucomicrobiae bacterium]|nr:hypothetical protein [Verrucomicrobiae bacterium]